MANDFRVLVTGADGFIGSHLVEMLVMEGYNVRGFCIYNSGGSLGWLDTLPQQIKSQIDVFCGDVRDPIAVREAMKGCRCVYHLAALIAIPYSYLAPYSYIETNINGTLNIVQAARDLEVERVVHTSTSETYGTAQFVPITEDHPLVAQSPYAASKIGADQIALSYFKSFQTPVTILRPFNTYGPRQSARAVIPTIISQIAVGSQRISLGSLKPTRDFNFVEDTCRAFIAVSLSDFTIGEIINSASNFEISIGDTASLIAEIMNAKIDISEDSSRYRPISSEVNRLFGDNTKLLKLTEWKPQYNGINGFRRGLEKTIDWFVDPMNLSYYRPDQYAV